MHAPSSLLNGGRLMAPPLQTVGAEADDEENRITPKKETPHAKKNSVSVHNPVTADRATRRQESKNEQPVGAAASSDSKDLLEQAIVNDENISKMAPSMVAGTAPADEQNIQVKDEQETPAEEKKDDENDDDAKSGFSRVKSILTDLKNTKPTGEEVKASKSAISRDPMFIKVEERLA